MGKGIVIDLYKYGKEHHIVIKLAMERKGT